VHVPRRRIGLQNRVLPLEYHVLHFAHGYEALLSVWGRSSRRNLRL